MNPHTIAEQRSLPPSVAGDAFLSTCQELSFPRCSPQEMLDAHSNNFHMRKLGDLPSQVLASTEISRCEGRLSHSLLNSNLTSSMRLNSEVEFTSGAFMPLRGSCPCLHGDDVTTAYSASVLARPLPATSRVGQEGQGPLSQSPVALKVPQQKYQFSKILNRQTLRSNSHELQSEIENGASPGPSAMH